MIILFILAIFMLQIPKSQQSELGLFNLAKSLERSGDYKKAAEIYERLYRKNPFNRLYIQSLVEINIKLKNYERAVALAKGWLERNPSDVGMQALVGDIYFKSGDRKNAMKAWKKAIEMGKDNPGTYRMVADYLIQNRLFDEAIKILKKARKVSGNPTLYGYEIAMLYSFMMKFDKATEEYVKLLRRSPGLLNVVQSRMLSYINKPEGLSSAILVLKKETSKRKTNFSLLELYAWLLIKAKDYGSALEVYKKMDKLGKRNGSEIFTFAHRMMSEKAYEYAMKAFMEVARLYPNSSLVPNAYFGYATALDASLRTKLKTKGSLDSNLISGFKKVKNLYKNLISRYPGTSIEGKALYNLALLELDIFFDLDTAEKLFHEIEKKYFLLLGVDAGLKLAKVYTLKGDLEKARKKYNDILKLKNLKDRTKVKFLLAKLDFYEGKFDSCLKKLEPIARLAKSDYSNDALELEMLIKLNRFPDEEPLKIYSKAELLEEQRRFGEAIALLENLIKNFPNHTIVDKATFKLAEIYKRIKKFDLAIKILNELISKFPESDLKDEALIEIAKIYKNKNNIELAIRTYEKLLSEFPSSIYVNMAREEIRKLRGDKR